MSNKKKTEYRFYEVVEEEDIEIENGEEVVAEDRLLAVLKCDFLTESDVWEISYILEDRLGVDRHVIWY